MFKLFDDQGLPKQVKSEVLTCVALLRIQTCIKIFIKDEDYSLCH